MAHTFARVVKENIFFSLELSFANTGELQDSGCKLQRTHLCTQSVAESNLVRAPHWSSAS